MSSRLSGQGKLKPEYVKRVEEALAAVFDRPMREIYSADPDFFIGEIRNGWTDVLKDYVPDCLSVDLNVDGFLFEGRGRYSVCWTAPPRISLEMAYQGEGYRVIFLLTAEGPDHRCELDRFDVLSDASQADCVMNFIRQLTSYRQHLQR